MEHCVRNSECVGATQVIFQMEQAEEHLHVIPRKVAFRSHSPGNWDYPTQQK